MVTMGKSMTPFLQPKFELPGLHFILYKLHLDLQIERYEHEIKISRAAYDGEIDLPGLEGKLKQWKKTRNDFLAKTGFKLFNINLANHVIEE